MATKQALETRLAVVAGFEDPHASLEQYPTPPGLAAHVVHLADLHDDIEGRTVVDLGAGTGMLCLAAALRGPARVVGVELDANALAIAQENRRRVGAATPVHWIRGDATTPPLDVSEPVTVVMNPPFGAQTGQRHADREFLSAAADLADVSYSIHNSGSQEFVESFASDNAGDVTHAFAAEFEMQRQFDHHTESTTDVDVEVYRIDWT